MGLGSLTVGRRLVLPYLAFALLIGTLASAVVGVETAAVASDQVNAAAGREEDSLAALVSGAERNQLLELRLLTAAAADHNSSNPAALHDALFPLLVNGGESRLSVLDRSGAEVLRMESAGGACVCSSPAKPLPWPHVTDILAGVADSLGDKWSGLVQDGGAWRVYTGGPLVSADGGVVGALILSQPLAAMLEGAASGLSFQLALYSPSGEQMVATDGFPLRAPELTDAQRARVMTSATGLRIALGGQDPRQLFFQPLRVRSAVVGYAAVVVDSSLLVHADNTLQFLLVGVAAALLLLVVVAGWHVTRSVTIPLERILKATEASRSVEDGPELPTNEMDRLVDSFESITSQLETATEATVLALAATIEARDAYTHGHSVRVAAYSLILARTAELDNAGLQVIRRGCLVHDIGKVGIPDGVLGKPGGLNSAELRAMQRHPEIGCQVLRALDWEPEVFEIVRQHHERWNGSGYPAGLRGEEISPLARIVAVADALDAMTSTRPYRVALSFQEAVRRIRAGAGDHFDPVVVKYFNAVKAELNFCRRSFENRDEPHHLLLEAIA